MNYEKQINELNERVKLRIAPSGIHGVGLFATRNLKKDEKLYTDHIPVGYSLPYAEFDKLLSDTRELMLERWPQIVNGSIFFYPDAKLQAYLNHSDKPNYDAQKDIPSDQF